MADLQVGIGADISDLRAGLKQAEGQISSFVDKVNQIGQLGDVLQGVGTKLTAGLTLPIVGLGAAAIKAFGDIEALKKGLEAVTGSADLAEAEFNKLKEVAKLPGLGMEEAVRGSINLQAIGMSADKSRKVLSQFGNAVATVGKGTAEFERAVYGVQQLANTDFPLGEDLNIIKDALPQVSDLLKEAFGTSRSDELTKMGVSSQQVLDTILVGLEKLPRVTGGIKGDFENLGDSMKTNLSRIGEIINKNLNISKLIDNITNFVDKAVTAFENLSPAVQQGALVFAGLAAAIGPVLTVIGTFMSMMPTMLSGLGALKVAFTAMTGPIGLVVIGVAAIVTAIVANWGKIKPYVLDTINYFISLYNESTLVRAGVVAIATAFKVSFAAIRAIVRGGWEVIKSFALAVVESFKGIGKAIKGALTGDFSMVTEGVRNIGTAISKGFVNVKNDVVNAAVDLFDEVKSTVVNGAKEIAIGKISLKTDIETPTVAKETASTIDTEVTKGVKSAADKLKTKPIKIELPDIEVVSSPTPKGLTNGLGMEFDSIEGLTAYNNRVKEEMAMLPTTINEAREGVSEALFNFGNAVNVAFQDIAMGSFSDTIFNVFSAAGEAIANGGNVLGAIGSSIVQGFAGFLSNMGKMLIEYGTLAVVKGKLDLAIAAGGPVSIGAGLAAIAVGAALSLAGSLLGSAAGGGFGGGGASSSNTSSGSSNYSSSYGGVGGGGTVVFRISGNDLVGVLSRQQDKNTRLNAGG